jgi:hypothetical protein
MKMHSTLIEKIITNCKNLGGYSNESRLLESIQNLNVAIYPTQKDQFVLVDAEKMLLEMAQRNVPTNNVSVLKLHHNAIKKIMDCYTTYSGYSNEYKLRMAIGNIEYTPYNSFTTGESFLVLKEDYYKALQQNPTS